MQLQIAVSSFSYSDWGYTWTDATVDANIRVAGGRGFGNVYLSGGFQADHFCPVWDLTASDMIISFTYDANGLVDDAVSHAWAELGIREVGYGDFNPTWNVEGAGVWLTTDYDGTVNTFDPDPVGFPTLDLDDKRAR